MRTGERLPTSLELQQQLVQTEQQLIQTEQRAIEAEQRAAKLAELLRSQGIDPDRM